MKLSATLIMCLLLIPIASAADFVYSKTDDQYVSIFQNAKTFVGTCEKPTFCFWCCNEHDEYTYEGFDNPNDAINRARSLGISDAKLDDLAAANPWFNNILTIQPEQEFPAAIQSTALHSEGDTLDPNRIRSARVLQSQKEDLTIVEFTDNNGFTGIATADCFLADCDQDDIIDGDFEVVHSGFTDMDDITDQREKYLGNTHGILPPEFDETNIIFFSDGQISLTEPEDEPLPEQELPPGDIEILAQIEGFEVVETEPVIPEPTPELGFFAQALRDYGEIVGITPVTEFILPDVAPAPPEPFSVLAEPEDDPLLEQELPPGDIEILAQLEGIKVVETEPVIPPQPTAPDEPSESSPEETITGEDISTRNQFLLSRIENIGGRANRAFHPDETLCVPSYCPTGEGTSYVEYIDSEGNTNFQKITYRLENIESGVGTIGVLIPKDTEEVVEADLPSSPSVPIRQLDLSLSPEGAQEVLGTPSNIPDFEDISDEPVEITDISQGDPEILAQLEGFEYIETEPVIPPTPPEPELVITEERAFFEDQPEIALTPGAVPTDESTVIIGFGHYSVVSDQEGNEFFLQELQTDDAGQQTPWPIASYESSKVEDLIDRLVLDQNNQVPFETILSKGGPLADAANSLSQEQKIGLSVKSNPLQPTPERPTITVSKEPAKLVKNGQYNIIVNGVPTDLTYSETGNILYDPKTGELYTLGAGDTLQAKLQSGGYVGYGGSNLLSGYNNIKTNEQGITTGTKTQGKQGQLQKIETISVEKDGQITTARIETENIVPGQESTTSTTTQTLLPDGTSISCTAGVTTCDIEPPSDTGLAKLVMDQEDVQAILQNPENAKAIIDHVRDGEDLYEGGTELVDKGAIKRNDDGSFDYGDDHIVPLKGGASIVYDDTNPTVSSFQVRNSDGTVTEYDLDTPINPQDLIGELGDQPVSPEALEQAILAYSDFDRAEKTVSVPSGKYSEGDLEITESGEATVGRDADRIPNYGKSGGQIVNIERNDDGSIDFTHNGQNLWWDGDKLRYGNKDGIDPCAGQNLEDCPTFKAFDAARKAQNLRAIGEGFWATVNQAAEFEKFEDWVSKKEGADRLLHFGFRDEQWDSAIEETFAKVAGIFNPTKKWGKSVICGLAPYMEFNDFSNEGNHLSGVDLQTVAWVVGEKSHAQRRTLMETEGEEELELMEDTPFIIKDVFPTPGSSYPKGTQITFSADISHEGGLFIHPSDIEWFIGPSKPIEADIEYESVGYGFDRDFTPKEPGKYKVRAIVKAHETEAFAKFDLEITEQQITESLYVITYGVIHPSGPVQDLSFRIVLRKNTPECKNQDIFIGESVPAKDANEEGACWVRWTEISDETKQIVAEELGIAVTHPDLTNLDYLPLWNPGNIRVDLRTVRDNDFFAESRIDYDTVCIEWIRPELVLKFNGKNPKKRETCANIILTEDKAETVEQALESRKKTANLASDKAKREKDKKEAQIDDDIRAKIQNAILASSGPSEDFQ